MKPIPVRMGLFESLVGGMEEALQIILGGKNKRRDRFTGRAFCFDF